MHQFWVDIIFVDCLVVIGNQLGCSSSSEGAEHSHGPLYPLHRPFTSWPFIPFILSLYTMALYTLPLLCFISYSESEPLVTQFVQVSQTWLSPKVYTLVRYMASIKIDGSMQIPFIMCTLFRDNRIQWQQSKKVSSSLTIGLQQLPSSGSIIPKLGLVGVHQPLRVGHRLVHVGKVFKVEISLWGGKDPFETLRSVQFILCL